MTDERRTGLGQEYLADRLSDFERAAFEKRLVNETELAQELEMSLRFREGLARLRDTGELEGLLRPRRPPYRLVFAGLAAVLLATLIIYAVYPRRSPVVMAVSPAALTAPATAPLRVAASYSLARMRAAVNVPTFPLPSTGALELRVLTPSAASGLFQVVLESTGPDVAPSRMGAVDHVRPDGDGFVAIYVNASLLKSGHYSITVDLEDSAAPIHEQFDFRLQQLRSAIAPGS